MTKKEHLEQEAENIAWAYSDDGFNYHVKEAFILGAEYADRQAIEDVMDLFLL